MCGEREEEGGPRAHRPLVWYMEGNCFNVGGWRDLNKGMWFGNRKSRPMWRQRGKWGGRGMEGVRGMEEGEDGIARAAVAAVLMCATFIDLS